MFLRAEPAAFSSVLPRTTSTSSQSPEMDRWNASSAEVIAYLPEGRQAAY
jgi:hypothetical protein